MRHQNQSKHTSISSTEEVLQRDLIFWEEKKSRIHSLTLHYEIMGANVLEMSVHSLASMQCIKIIITKSPCIDGIFLL